MEALGAWFPPSEILANTGPGVVRVLGFSSGDDSKSGRDRDPSSPPLRPAPLFCPQIRASTRQLDSASGACTERARTLAPANVLGNAQSVEIRNGELLGEELRRGPGEAGGQPDCRRTPGRSEKRGMRGSPRGGAAWQAASRCKSAAAAWLRARLPSFHCEEGARGAPARDARYRAPSPASRTAVSAARFARKKRGQGR